MTRKIDYFAGFVHERYSAWRAARSKKRESWDDYYRQWRCMESAEDKTRKSERSQVKMPATKAAVDTAHDALMMTLFGRDPWFLITGREPRDYVPADTLTFYLKFLFERENFVQKFSDFVLELCYAGTGIGRVEIETTQQQRVITERVPQVLREIDSEGNETRHEVGERMEPVSITKSVNRPKFSYVPLYNFFIDPAAMSIPDAEGVIVRAFPRVEKLWRMEQAGSISGVKRLLSRPTTPPPESANMGGIRNRLSMGGIVPAATEKNRHMTLEWWGWADKKTLQKSGFKGEIGDDGAEVFSIVGPDQTTLKLISTPFITKERPFVASCFQKIPDEFYGLGIPEITTGPQRALDATVRSRIDNKAMAINTMFAMNLKRMVPGQSMSLFPGKTFFTNDDVDKTIKQFEVRDVTSGSYRDAAEYERYIQDAPGISRGMGGMPVKRGEMSATESAYLQQQQSVRIRALVSHIERTAVKPILKWYYKMVIQFLDVPEIIQVVGPQGDIQSLSNITPETLSGNYDFIPQGTVSIQAENKIAKLQQLVTLALSSPMGQQLIDFKKYIEVAGRLMDVETSDILRPISQEQAIVNSQAMQTSGSVARPPEMRQQGGTAQ